MLAERLEFFIPSFTTKSAYIEVLVYISAWVLLIATLRFDTFTNTYEFIVYGVLHFIILTITIFTATFLIEAQKESLKLNSRVVVYFKVLILCLLIASFVSFSVMFLVKALGLLSLTISQIMSQSGLYVLKVAVFNMVLLIYFMRRYDELLALQASFERKLHIQNDHIKSRLEPHSLFNTINTLTSLIEIDSEKEAAAKLLQHVSFIFRASLNEPTETGFENELELCEHYLEIERYRLQDKLVVNWDLPDSDLIYDMSITAFTLQQVLEQAILHASRLTTDTVTILVKVRWIDNRVNIQVSVNIPVQSVGLNRAFDEPLDFSNQAYYLKRNFGNSARIILKEEDELATNQDSMEQTENYLEVIIDYPLHDALMTVP